MRTLYLVRHAETAWNQEGRYQGQTDVPLHDIGRAQALALRERLQHRALLFDAQACAVVSSDLARAKESAEIAFAVDGRVIRLEPGLRELRYGIFEGLKRDEIKERYGEDFVRFNREQGFVVEGSEARGEGRARALAAITRLLAELPHAHIIVMTHGGILRQLLLHTFLDGEMPTDLGFANMCVHTVHIDGSDWTYAGSI